MAVLYEARDYSFPITVYEDYTKTVILPASGYSNAQYRIYQTGSCEPLVSKSLSDGITNVGDPFIVVFSDTDINFSGARGAYTHAFSVGENEFEVLPDVFNETVRIIASCGSGAAQWVTM